MKKRKINIGIIAVVLLFFFGAALILYPHLSKMKLDAQTKSAIDEFKEQMELLNPPKKPSSTEEIKPTKVPVTTAKPTEAPSTGNCDTQPDKTNTAIPEETIQPWELYKDSPFYEFYIEAYKYNEEIYNNHQVDLKDQESYQEPLFNLSDYGMSTNVFGYISIPKINEELPIYLGASKANMALGAVNMTYTSLPLDQENTNCVIAAHRGWIGANYFKYIDKIEPGDEIIVHTPWSVLTYTVFETKVIKKDDMGQVLIREGKTMLTLSSCHPYTKNTHRYLVFAELTDCYIYGT